MLSFGAIAGDSGRKIQKRGPLRKILIIIGGIVSVILVVSGFTVVIGQIVANRSLRSEVNRLYAAASQVEAGVIGESELDGLPEPIERWLRSSNVVGKERAKTVRLRQSGELRQNEGSGWTPFEAEQYYTTNPPQFLWRATFKFTFIPFMEVRDSYREGIGKTAVKLASLIPVGTLTGPEMDHGNLVRFLNEIVWFPSAALSDYIEWSPIDSQSARATISHGSVTASAIFHVDEVGRLTEMIAHRYFKSGDDYSLEQWSTHFSEHTEMDGIQVPTRGTAVWNLESRDFFDIQVELTDIDYNVDEPY